MVLCATDRADAVFFLTKEEVYYVPHTNVDHA